MDIKEERVEISEVALIKKLFLNICYIYLVLKRECSHLAIV